MSIIATYVLAGEHSRLLAAVWSVERAKHTIVLTPVALWWRCITMNLLLLHVNSAFKLTEHGICRPFVADSCHMHADAFWYWTGSWFADFVLENWRVPKRMRSEIERTWSMIAE
jgi:hypothetical protein